jgi:hypothetical protein
MSFVSTSDAQTAVAGVLKVAFADLPSYWTGVVADSQVSAYQEIEAQLLDRGYILSQVLLWDRGAEFEKDLTIFWALTRGGGLSGMYDDRFIKMFDRRKDLATVAIAISGKYVSPSSDSPGGITTGARSTTGDVFAQPTRDLPGRGQAFDW